MPGTRSTTSGYRCLHGTYTGTSGLGAFIYDIKTHQKRDFTVKDIADLVKVADALAGADYIQTSLTATEVPHATHGLHELWTAFQNTTKHVQGVASRPCNFV